VIGVFGFEMIEFGSPSPPLSLSEILEAAKLSQNGRAELCACLKAALLFAAACVSHWPLPGFSSVHYFGLKLINYIMLTSNNKKIFHQKIN